jgi:hypothetical protein
MPISRVSKVFAVKDAKIERMITDASGAAPTYAAAIDVPGIKSVTIGGDVTSVELRGDNTKLDGDSVLSGITVEFEYAKMSLDALNVFLGASITDTGVTPNQVASLSVKPTDVFNYFRFRAVSAGADTLTGDVLFTLHKCKLDSFPELGLAEEDYQTFTVSGFAVPILGTGQPWLDVALRETSVALT